MKKNEKLIIYSDGGARGNPGPAGIGCVFYDEYKKRVTEVSKYIGETTNNQAEYKAVITALETAKRLGAKEVKIYSDSELVTQQLNQKYKIKNKDLAPLFVRIWNLSIGFKKVTYHHIYRELNKEADKLVNKAIDGGI